MCHRRFVDDSRFSFTIINICCVFTVQEKFDLKLQNPRGVFANNELELADVDVFGFDYDYTLAGYSPELYPLIYHLAKQQLVNHFKVGSQWLQNGA